MKYTLTCACTRDGHVHEVAEAETWQALWSAARLLLHESPELEGLDLYAADNRRLGTFRRTSAIDGYSDIALYADTTTLRGQLR